MAEGVRKRGNKWSYYFDTAKIDGKRKKIEKGGFRTQKEALEARTAAMAEYNNTGRTFQPKEISVSDYLDYWLENAIKKNIDHGYSYNTYVNYAGSIRTYIKPQLGMYKLSSLQYSPDIIQSWVDNMKAANLSKNRITNILTCLTSSLNYAVTPLKYINYNPCCSVKVGKFPVNIKAKEKNNYICTKEDFNHIIERFPAGDKFNLSLLVPYNTGTRISETFAIDLLQDIDFGRHEININKQIFKKDKDWYIKPPKYDSYRIIKIGTTLENALKNAVELRKNNISEYGANYLNTYITSDNKIIQLPADSDIPPDCIEFVPLCTKTNGKILTPESFKFCARIIHYELNIPLFHAHCLRHTHGTILAENGVNPKTVMERLGHKNIETTLQTYTFNTEVMQQYAVDIFEKTINS